MLSASGFNMGMVTTRRVFSVSIVISPSTTCFGPKRAASPRRQSPGSQPLSPLRISFVMVHLALISVRCRYLGP